MPSNFSRDVGCVSYRNQGENLVKIRANALLRSARCAVTVRLWLVVVQPLCPSGFQSRMTATSELS